VCKSLDEVLSDNSIQGVVVALAARHHYDIAKQVLNAGKHLFVEKPLTLSYGQALELVNLAAAQGCQIMVGHLPRFHPAFTKLVELVQQGEVGDLRYISSHRLSLGRIRGDENCLWDLAPHDLSMILALTGSEPIETTSHGSCNFEDKLIDTGMVHMTFPEGVKAHVYNSWMHPVKEHRFTVIGSSGMLVFDDTKDWDQKLMVYHHVIEKRDALNYHTEMKPGQPVALEQGEPLKLECQHFLDCIRYNLEPLTGPQDALLVMKVLEKSHIELADTTPNKRIA
jgi:UDP-2-acetamido-3-amino-2,3-dideoxy-glucuronate N-acetyltransferase